MSTQNIFGSEIPSVDNASDGTAYSLGTRFKPQVNGTITGIRWYFPLSVDAVVPVKAGLYYMPTSYLMDQTEFSLSAAPGWNSVDFDTPLVVTAGELYQAAIWTPHHYVATNNYSWPKTSGDLITETPGGFFTAGEDFAIPNNSFSNGNYFVDVLFTPEGDEEVSEPLTITIWNGTIEISVGGVVVWDGTTEVPANVDTIV